LNLAGVDQRFAPVAPMPYLGDMDYRVYGIDSKGERHEVRRTKLAREARTVRDAGNSPWVRSVVFGSDGELTVAELDRLADMDHRYA
jgi:hypothetical protein